MNKVKILLRIFFGILTIITVTFIVFYIFNDIIKVRNAFAKTWIPLLGCSLGFYLAGLTNKKTKLFFTLLLYPSLLIFFIFRISYLHLILLIILFSTISLVITRKEINIKFRCILSLIMLLLFGYFLFSQPLIIEHKNHGIDKDGNLINVTQLWDFNNNSPKHISNEFFIDEKGNKVKLSSFKGKNLYITFWATWCGSCLAEKPQLEKLKKKHQENDSLIFIDISTDRYVDQWKNYLSENNPAGIQLIVKNELKTMSDFQFSGIPFNIIVNTEGEFRTCHRPSFLNEEILISSKTINKYIHTPRRILKKQYSK